jgi:hypothetical protein
MQTFAEIPSTILDDRPKGIAR